MNKIIIYYIITSVPNIYYLFIYLKFELACNCMTYKRIYAHLLEIKKVQLKLTMLCFIVYQIEFL